MKDFLEVLKLLRDTPVPILLVGGGLVFLFISIGGQFGATINTDKTRVKEKTAAIVGSILLIFGIALYIVPPIFSILLENNGANNTGVPDSSDQNTLVIEPTVTPTSLSTESDKLPVFRGQKTTTVNA